MDLKLFIYCPKAAVLKKGGTAKNRMLNRQKEIMRR